MRNEGAMVQLSIASTWLQLSMENLHDFNLICISNSLLRETLNWSEMMTL
jgi:hypothetical protein